MHTITLAVSEILRLEHTDISDLTVVVCVEEQCKRIHATFTLWLDRYVSIRLLGRRRNHHYPSEILDRVLASHHTMQ